MRFIQKTLLLGVGMAAASSSAMAAFTFVDGDMILGFQATGGTGSDKNVFFNLGSPIAFRDNTNQSLLGNINTTLTSAFGATWYSRSDVYFGVAANLNAKQAGASETVTRGATVNGDPSRTFYVSSAAATPGTGSLYLANTFSTALLGTGGTTFSGLESILPDLTTQGDGAAILTESLSPVQWQNGWKALNPTPGAAFDVFTGGIQQSFGQVASTTYADVQRILSTNSFGANPTGVVGGGTYEFTLGIGSDGSISAVPEVSSTFLLGAIGLSAAFQRRRKQLA